MRDLQRDKEICEKATSGLWEVEETHNGCLIILESKANTDFIVESRKGWPGAIDRAIKAEARVKKLEEALNKIVNYEKNGNFKNEGWNDSFFKTVDIARNALKGGGKE